MMDEDKCKVTKNFITVVVNPFAKLLCVKNLGMCPDSKAEKILAD